MEREKRKLENRRALVILETASPDLDLDNRDLNRRHLAQGRLVVNTPGVT